MSDAGTEFETAAGGGAVRDTRMDGIPLDEPTFIIRAADPLSALTVRNWAAVHALNPKCPQRMLNAALAIADLMDRWPDRKWPGE